MSVLKLQSAEGEIFKVDVDIAKQSAIIKTMLEDLGMCDDDNDEVIPLPNVNAPILDKILHWAAYHIDDIPPIDEKKEKRSDDISPWDAEFINVDLDTLIALILAANYMDIKGLLDLGCKTVANMIKGRTPEEIRTAFNIKNDFTPIEEAQNAQANGYDDVLNK